MKNDDVEKAALERCVSHDDLFKQYFIDGFKAGAEWSSQKTSWINVNEKLPELRERVLVAYWSIGKISICIMKRLPHDTANPNNPKWYWSLENNKGNVIAWMPIPVFNQNEKSYEK